MFEFVGFQNRACTTEIPVCFLKMLPADRQRVQSRKNEIERFREQGRAQMKEG